MSDAGIEVTGLTKALALNGASLYRADRARFAIDAVHQPDTYRRRVHLASPRR